MLSNSIIGYTIRPMVLLTLVKLCDARRVSNIGITSTLMTSLHTAPTHNKTTDDGIRYFKQIGERRSAMSTNQNVTNVLSAATSSTASSTEEPESVGFSAWSETITNIIIMAFLGGVIFKYLKIAKAVRELRIAAQEAIARSKANKESNTRNPESALLEEPSDAAPKSLVRDPSDPSPCISDNHHNIHISVDDAGRIINQEPIIGSSLSDLESHEVAECCTTSTDHVTCKPCYRNRLPDKLLAACSLSLSTGDLHCDPTLTSTGSLVHSCHCCCSCRLVSKRFQPPTPCRHHGNIGSLSECNSTKSLNDIGGQKSSNDLHKWRMREMHLGHSRTQSGQHCKYNNASEGIKVMD